MSCLSIRSWILRMLHGASQTGPETKSLSDESRRSLVRDHSNQACFIHKDLPPHEQYIPPTQHQLLVHAPHTEHILAQEAVVSAPRIDQEALIKIQTIGLNPIDWKGPAYNFGLPSLPCVLGRDYVGIVVRAPMATSRIRAGDLVLAISTDYRDYRKAAYQQYAVANDFNLVRLPTSLHPAEDVAAAGVAFVTAIITLGVCLGLQFPESLGGQDLLSLVRSNDVRDKLPEDIRAECLFNLEPADRLQAGDWLAIWGAGSTIGYLILQLAKLAGVRVVCVADATSSRAAYLVDAGADVLVHRKDTDEAQAVIRAVTRGGVRYGIDTVGKETAGWLQATLASSSPSSQTDGGRKSHTVGLTGLPKEPPPHIVQHKVPIKLFHEVPAVGAAVVGWMERLLAEGKLALPLVETHPETGLGAINGALHRLRKGEIEGQRIVVRMREESADVS